MFDGRFADTTPAFQLLVLAPLNAARTAPRRRRLSLLLKRIFDFTASLAAVVIFAPLLALIAILVAATSSGPVLLRQRRTGQDGRVFHILKFRTMTVTEDGDHVAHAVRGDKRVTAVGAVLRRTSLDELPQLFNVLRGEMSIVGPRPHALAHDTHYGAIVPHYGERFKVRPGLTGFAQIQGLRGEIHTVECMARRATADANYAVNWSFRRDLAIIAQTVPLLLRRTNAY